MAQNTKMSEALDNLVLEHLCHMRGLMEELRLDMREVKSRLSALEQQYATISNRVDRIDDRLERIELRVGLLDA
jgi:predicted  nucleic acid-binding Zn-ribbon protein